MSPVRSDQAPPKDRLNQLPTGFQVLGAALPEIDKIQVHTAFITGNLEKLGEAVASLFRKPGNRDERLKLLAFGSIWAAYAFGAAIGALAARQFGKHSLLVPASILCISAILVFLTQSRSK
jgi:uncharacterized membrane protein YoaK (UPF0700 family)